jgi:uroporphyrin-III C-methyltransferase/precorrin-2 dehydrogenase/sirohydrochlorin ferrochelatase
MQAIQKAKSMMRYFPIFVDLHAVPPLIIGDAPVLAAKLRLLLKAAPVVEVMAGTDVTWRAAFAEDAGVSWRRPINGPTGDARDLDLRAAIAAIKGRPLVIIETEDAALNHSLVAAARAYGVPVNVPDKIDLCSFYLAAIVDRAPLIVAISTSGLAPVLGQVIRAKIETMLVPHYGQLVGFLAACRQRLVVCTPARIRQIQRAIINGPAAQKFLAGDAAGAKTHVDALVEPSQSVRHHPSLTVIACGTGETALLPAAAAAAIRAADHIFYEPSVSDEWLEIARREVTLTKCDDRYDGQYDDRYDIRHGPNTTLKMLRNSIESGAETVLIIAGRQAVLDLQAARHPIMRALAHAALPASYIAAGLRPVVASAQIVPLPNTVSVSAAVMAADSRLPSRPAGGW